MTHSKTALVAALLTLIALSACSRQQPAPPAAQAQTPPAANVPTTAHPVTPVAQATAPAIGPVLEVIEAGTYTYVRVKANAGELWAVAPRSIVKVGDRVVIPMDMPAPNYHSPSLNRDFPMIYFATTISREGDAPPAGMPPMPPMASAHGSTARAPAEAAAGGLPEAVTPAVGGTKVAAIWADSKALDGKTVTVRGKVVKFNAGILGRNWLHIQDGSGKPADGTHDLTVTTDGVAQVGDIVTVTGKVGLNKDFGAGYVYRVIVEGASVSAK